MIYKLRKNFIKICMLSFLAVFVVLFSAIYFITTFQTARSLDVLADIISDNNGRFPEEGKTPPNDNHPLSHNKFDAEIPFRTRYFTVSFSSSGDVRSVNTQAIVSVNEPQAIELAGRALEQDEARGWIDEFRYKMFDTPLGREIIFINAAVEMESNRSFMAAVLGVFGGGSLVMLLLIVIISRRAVKPTAESYAKQKQFITDANHELKTPLTLIRTNLEIMEAENGSNEWLSDINEEVAGMTALVNNLVALARMDEDQEKPQLSAFDLSRAVDETVDMFERTIVGSGRQLSVNIPENIIYNGDEGSVRQLVSILMDNAVKYCDNSGIICVTLNSGRHPVLTVDNSYAAVGELELERLFDRFYRADKARSYGGGFGVGLSMAKAIVEKHRGSITAQGLGDGMIRFSVKL